VRGMTNHADNLADAAQMPWEQRFAHNTIYELMGATAKANAQRPALSFQIKSGPKDAAETLNWARFFGHVTQAANLFRRLGVHEDDVVAYLLPNCNEAMITFLGGMAPGKVFPINPTLSPDKIASLLRDTGAKIVVTMAPFPKSEVADVVAEAISDAPNVETVLEVDLKRYLTPPLSWIVPLIRPKRKATHNARTLNFNAELAKEDATRLTFTESGRDRVAALFHTGGTTGMPKVVQHQQQGLLYNAWVAAHVLARPEDVLLCPLPMFHVFGAVVVGLASIGSGAHLVMPTPQGYRGEGVMDNFWKLVERWEATFIVMVPTAATALMQRPIDAKVDSLISAFCGSAPLPQELFKRFQDSTGVRILEGYGMTEATCLISGNPFNGEKKIGSVGITFPYTQVRILHCDEAGKVTKECAKGEIGEICVSNPGIHSGHTYTDASRNLGLYADGKWLRTGDLGRFDEDDYLFITGRAKDLIRGACRSSRCCHGRRNWPAGRKIGRAALRLCRVGGGRADRGRCAAQLCY